MAMDTPSLEIDRREILAGHHLPLTRVIAGMNIGDSNGPISIRGEFVSSNLNFRLLACLTLACALFNLIGCGGKKPSTLPPVDRESKQAAPDSAVVDSAALAKPSDELLAWVIRDKVNVRSQPATTSDVVAQLARGAQVQLIELANKWWKVLLADGRTAFIYEPLLTRERYVDPWERFRMESGRSDPNLNIVTGVTGLDSEVPAAAITVGAKWATLPREERESVGEAAFKFWCECVKKCGYDPLQTRMVFRDESGREVGSAIYEDGKPVVTLAE